VPGHIGCQCRSCTARRRLRHFPAEIGIIVHHAAFWSATSMIASAIIDRTDEKQSNDMRKVDINFVIDLELSLGMKDRPIAARDGSILRCLRSFCT
jgi:hypothetical protein